MKFCLKRMAAVIIMLFIIFSLLWQVCVTAAAEETSSMSSTQLPTCIRMDITRISNNTDSFDINAPHTWIIRGDVPDEIAYAQDYIITDTIDYRLTYQTGSPRVTLCTRANTELTLSQDAHYVLTEGKVLVDRNNVDQFAISLTRAGMAYIASNLGAGEKTPEIRVYFQAVINKNASMGQQIPNGVHLSYTDSEGIAYASDSNVSQVYTGGVSIQKTDISGQALAGAAFQIARLATQSELEQGNGQVELLYVEQEKLQVVFVDFFPSKDFDGEKVWEVTTDESGKAAICGLAYGTYYIVESKAAAGYNRMAQPIAVIISDVSHLTAADGWKDAQGNTIDNTLNVVNTKFLLPDTGGIGTTVFTVLGLGIIGSAGMLLFVNRKRRYY